MALAFDKKAIHPLEDIVLKEKGGPLFGWCFILRKM
jgi:hypothetical protein